MSAPDDGSEAQTGAQSLEWLSLDEGERVEWAGHPARISMVPGLVWGVVLLPLFGLGLLIILGSVLRIRNTDYVVTTQALYVKRGILSTTIESVGLDKIQNTEYRQSFLGRQFGYGSIEISTAGSGGTDLSFAAIEGARSVRETINRLSTEYAGGGGRDTDGEHTVDAGDPMAELLAELTATREALEGAERALRERAEENGSSADGTDSGADGTDSGTEGTEEAFSFEESVEPEDDSTADGDLSEEGESMPEDAETDE